MERELLDLFESAKKAADAAANDGSEEGRCVDALKELKKFPVTMQVLVKTQVGKRLRPLTKHHREKIQAVASELLEIWKRIVLDETAKNKLNGAADARSSTNVAKKTGKVEKFQEVDSVKVDKVQKAESVNVEKVSRSDTIKVEKTGHSEKVSRLETVQMEKAGSIRVEKNGGVEAVKVEKITKEDKQGTKRLLQAPTGPPKLTSMVKCNDSARDKIRESLAEALSKVSNEADQDIVDEVNACDPIRMAVSVESALFGKWGHSTGPKKPRYRSVMFNISDRNNPDLRRRILLGEIKPERLINMSGEEMASDQRKKENNQIKEKALFECERGGPPKATTDQFRCSRCGQRKCTYYQMQTRSADEPMTTYVTCVNCNNHWKFC